MKPVTLIHNELPAYYLSRQAWVSDLSEHHDDNDSMFVIFYGCVALMAWTAVGLVWWYS